MRAGRVGGSWAAGGAAQLAEALQRSLPVPAARSPAEAQASRGQSVVPQLTIQPMVLRAPKHKISTTAPNHAPPQH